MSLKRALTAVVLTGLTTRTLRNLRSISNSLTQAELEQIATESLSGLRHHIAHPATDLGLLVDRLLPEAEAQRRLGLDAQAACAAVLAGDVQAQGDLDLLARRAAGVLSSQLHLLRDTIPGEADILLSRVQQALPEQTARQLALPEPGVVGWGRLGDPVYRFAVTAHGQKTLNQFKDDRFTTQMVVTCVDRAQRLTVPVISAEALAVEGLEAGPVADYLTKPGKLAQLASRAHFAMVARQVEDLPSLAHDLGQLADVAERGLALAAVEGPLRQSLSGVADFALTLHGALLAYLNTTAKDVLLLESAANEVRVNPIALEGFLAQGGTMADIVNHRLMLQITNIPLPRPGIGADVVLKQREQASQAVSRYQEQAKTNTKQLELTALRQCLSRALDGWNGEHQLAVSDNSQDERHLRLRDRALTEISRGGSLIDAVTGYLVEMRATPDLVTLQRDLKKDFQALVTASESIQPAAADRCFCRAASAVLLGFLDKTALIQA